jgi:Fe-S cluster assembly protein SufD
MPITTSPPAGAFSLSAFEALLRSQPEWLAAQKREAFALYQQKLNQPLNPEEYKRVDLRTFQPQKFSLANETTASEFTTLLQDRADFGGAVAHVDGHTVRSELAPELAAKGVLFGDLATLLVEHRTQIEPHFLSAVKPETDRFSAWHSAFWTGGTCLYVPKNVRLDRPLYSRIGLSQPNAADFSHTLVILEDGAEATFLEETASSTSDAAGLHVGAVE